MLVPRSIPAVIAPGLHPADDGFLFRVREIIRERLGEEGFNVADLASTLGLDRTTLFRRLQGLTGDGPLALIRRSRLEHAAHLLAQPDRVTVGDAAHAVGFKSVAHFCKSFRDAYGLSPGAWAGAAGEAFVD